MTVWEKVFGPSLKRQLLQQMELQSRQHYQDRQAFQDMLIAQQMLTEKLHAHTTAMVDGVTKSILEQSQSFNRYLDLITPKGDPQVRVMNDATEAKYEAEYMKAHEDVAVLAREGVPVDAPLVDQLAYQSVIAEDLANMMKDLHG